MARQADTRRVRRLLGALFVATLTCAPAQAQTKEAPGPRIASVEGGVEAAVDAPWRLEPDLVSSLRYPRIPIVVSIHDSSLQSPEGPSVQLGTFCEMQIREETSGGPAPIENFGPARLSEVERSDKWPNNSAGAAQHRLCRAWAGEQCSAADLDVGPTAEWHATALYTPRNQTPGADVRLSVQVRVASAGHACGAPHGALTEHFPEDRMTACHDGTCYLITNRLSVHLGEDGLPRFDGGWVYGDLHYHSQGTDNEGESAHAYRPTLQAMRAMGLDFLFATDHASDSEQITDINIIYLRNIDVPDWLPRDGDLEDFLESIPLHEETRSYAARDMNRVRFKAMLAWLNGAQGANAEVMKVDGRQGTARLFLGGEVDVLPEMSAAEKASGMIRYGNGLGYHWRTCVLDPELVEKIQHYTSSIFCANPHALGELDPQTGQYWVHDIQGVGDDSYYARQHMVYLPLDGDPGDPNDSFVSSHSTQFGGGHERLRDLLDGDYHNTLVDKGYAFLAHPVDAESGAGLSRLGPDIIPYSDVQLKTAFASKWVLGLELWNEDTRLRSSDSFAYYPIPGFPVQDRDGVGGPDGIVSRWLWSKWLGPQPQSAYTMLHHGLFAWDKMLLWGIRPTQTAGIDWLPAGQPRRVFMAGGSDAHGDLNYRREGRLAGIASVVDTAIGKPRNLVHVGLDRPETVTGAGGEAFGVLGQGQVTTALASGHFSITDGPALRIALDVNGNGRIDDADVPMGGLSSVPTRGTWLPFVVEWKSTAEFGPLAGVDLYVGVTADSLDTGFVYAPAGHGIHSATTRSGNVAPHPWIDAQGGAHPELWDSYMLDPTGRLRFTPASAEAMQGRRVVFLKANDYLVGRRRIDQEEPVCRWNVYCNKPGDDRCAEECTEPSDATYHFDSPRSPDRIFVRAFARTVPEGGAQCAPEPNITFAKRRGECIERLAFTNPVWVDNTVAPPDFTVSCSPSPLSLYAGTSGSSTCTLRSVNSFASPVALGCSGPLAPITCSASPSTVTPPANGTVAFTLNVVVGAAAPGSYSVRLRGTGGGLLREPLVPVTVLAGAPPPPPPGGGALYATFDAALAAPSCGTAAGFSCDTGAALVAGRSVGGRERNTPNTLAASCADGADGAAGERWDAVDRIRVYSADGTRMSSGGLARIDATVWVAGTASDYAVDFFLAADADNPSWTLVRSVVPAGKYAQTASTVVRLAPTGRQAVRVQLRQGRTADPCAAGDFNDRDDLAFAVAVVAP